MTASDEMVTEHFPPPSNLPPGDTFVSQALFALRKLLDLQVASVLQHLAPWLAQISGSVLEVGCGAQPYRHLVSKSCQYRGLDWEGSQDHFKYRTKDTTYYSGGAFPFEDGSFDNLFHTEVLEHIYDTEFFLKECRRVLRLGGRFFFSVPFQARYHYIPYDFWRFTPAALERMLNTAGFTDVAVTPRGTDITVAAYKSVSLIYRWLQGGLVSKLFGIVATPFALVSLFIGHVSLRYNLGSPDDCLGYTVSARA